MEQRLTAEERLTLKTGAFGAVFLVANADPGMLALFRESFAASGAMADSSGVVKEALTSGPLPKLPRDSALEIESVVLPALGRAVGILRREVAGGRGGLPRGGAVRGRAGGQRAPGVTPAEAAAIERIRDAWISRREPCGDQSARTMARTQRSRSRPQAHRYASGRVRRQRCRGTSG